MYQYTEFRKKDQSSFNNKRGTSVLLVCVQKAIVGCRICFLIFLKRFIAHRVYTVRTSIKNKIVLVLLTQYCAGDKIEKNEMGRACGAYG